MPQVRYIIIKINTKVANDIWERFWSVIDKFGIWLFKNNAGWYDGDEWGGDEHTEYFIVFENKKDQAKQELNRLKEVYSLGDVKIELGKHVWDVPVEKYLQIHNQKEFTLSYFKGLEDRYYNIRKKEFLKKQDFFENMIFLFSEYLKTKDIKVFEKINLKDLKDFTNIDYQKKDLSIHSLRELSEIASIFWNLNEIDDKGIWLSDSNVKEVYDLLVNNYLKQPKLNVRTHQTILDNQFSTPIPIAFLLGYWADNNSIHKTILDPTAGNGLLAFYFYLKPYEIDKLCLNEKEKDRAKLLRIINTLQQNICISENDIFYATKEIDNQTGYDIVLINPPFANQNKKIYSDYNRLDFSIILYVLENYLNPFGRAVLLFHGGIGDNNKIRKDFWDNKGLVKRGEERDFFIELYTKYNVVDKFTISGKLWERQGQSTNIRIALIDGKNKDTETKYPPLYNKDYDRIIKTWDELFNRVISTKKNLKQIKKKYYEIL